MASLSVLISEAEIQKRISELGAQIAQDYPEGDLVVICILKGAWLFHADLVRSIPRPVRIDFMGISSYGAGKTSSGQVKVTKDLDKSVQDAHLLIVEDIIDSGITLNYLTEQLKARQPKSIAIAALLDKPEHRQRDVEARYIGFRIPDEFVVGYGLDYAEDYRYLRDVCVLSE